MVCVGGAAAGDEEAREAEAGTGRELQWRAAWLRASSSGGRRRNERRGYKKEREDGKKENREKGTPNNNYWYIKRRLYIYGVNNQQAELYPCTRKQYSKKAMNIYICVVFL